MFLYSLSEITLSDTSDTIATLEVKWQDRSSIHEFLETEPSGDTEGARTVKFGAWKREWQGETDEGHQRRADRGWIGWNRTGRLILSESKRNPHAARMADWVKDVSTPGRGHGSWSSDTIVFCANRRPKTESLNPTCSTKGPHRTGKRQLALRTPLLEGGCPTVRYEGLRQWTVQTRLTEVFLYYINCLGVVDLVKSWSVTKRYRG